MFGESNFHCFSFGDHEEDNVLVVDCLDRSMSTRPVVRVQSACYTAEIFRSTDCDCHGQLAASLHRVHLDGGLVLYMLADGRGAGLLTKVRALAMWAEEQIDTYDAYQRMGVDTDPRDYQQVGEVLKYFKVSTPTLLTNNPRKVSELRSHGIDALAERLRIPPTNDSIEYLTTKQTKMNHDLGLEL